jgi:hypothetical protein
MEKRLFVIGKLVVGVSEDFFPFGLSRVAVCDWGALSQTKRSLDISYGVTVRVTSQRLFC